ncbi:MAG TPA: sugar phosphate isomerase/epimerase family protein [Planctomycetota bacterium]
MDTDPTSNRLSVPDRRTFLRSAAALGAAGLAARPLAAAWQDPIVAAPVAPRWSFDISLAQWSFHREFFGGQLLHLNFAARAREFGIGAVEYVNSFFKDKALDAAFLAEMNHRCDGEGVRSLLIMCDGEGRLGDPVAAERTRAVANHHKWLVAAAMLGCHSIRVNAASEGSFEEQQKLAADGLRRLCELADSLGLNVIVENHGGLSSHGGWLAGVMKAVAHPRCGTLPDFGNFRVSAEQEYDRYLGVAELMPYAKAVSAKSHDFDAEGNETHTDYLRMMKLVQEAGYSGFVGIEYEGGGLSERDGVLATKRLLERVREKLA